jgi:predicted PurR-regulated permease PerM
MADETIARSMNTRSVPHDRSQNMSRSQADLAQFTLGVAFVVLLAAASFWVLKPFLLALVWATMIVISTWPVMTTVQRRLGGRRGAAVAVMTLLLLLAFIVPFGLAIAMVVTNVPEIASWFSTALTWHVPTAPQWVSDLPVVGERAAAFWNDLATGGLARLKPYATQAVTWFAGQLGSVGAALVHMLFTLVISIILYGLGDVAAHGVRLFFQRLAGDRGDRAVVLAAQAVRGVALGVVVTAIAQTAVGGIGLALSGAPFAGPLTLLILLLCIAQIGPLLVLGPAVIWMYSTGDSVSATVLLVFTVVAGAMDNVLRPYLIKKGADLPLLLIFAGVIGGLLSLGVVGIFVGPVVLAVTYRLVGEWVRSGTADPSPEAAAGDDAPA